MSLFDAILQPQVERGVNEATRIADALERIALCLETLTTIPAQPPSKPVTEAALGMYGTALTEANSPDDLRERLHAAGLSDHEVEEQVVKMMFGDED